MEAASLEQINSDLTQGRDYLNTYLQDTEANASTLTSSVDTTVMSALNNAVRMLPAPPAAPAVRAAQESSSRYKDAMDTEVESLRGNIADLKHQLAEAGEQRAQDAETASESLAQLQAKIAEGDQQVATQTTQLQEQIETQRASFSEEVGQRETAFKETETARETSAQEARDQQVEQATALLTDLQTYRKQASDLLDATNRDVVSGDYRGWATKQATAAFRWTVTTVVLGLVAVGALVVVVLTAENDSVQFLLSKSTVGIIGLIIAGYAARQAAEHRREERTANRLALDLRLWSRSWNMSMSRRSCAARSPSGSSFPSLSATTNRGSRLGAVRCR